MKIFRSTLILVMFGILIQKFFPAGRTFQKIRQIAGIQEPPKFEKAFVPVRQSEAVTKILRELRAARDTGTVGDWIYRPVIRCSGWSRIDKPWNRHIR